MSQVKFTVRGKNYNVDVEDSTTVEEIIKMLNEKGANVQNIIVGGILSNHVTVKEAEFGKCSKVMAM